MVAFHCLSSCINFPQFFHIVFSILLDFSDHVVWMVSILTQRSISSGVGGVQHSSGKSKSPFQRAKEWLSVWFWRSLWTLKSLTKFYCFILWTGWSKAFAQFLLVHSSYPICCHSSFWAISLHSIYILLLLYLIRLV